MQRFDDARFCGVLCRSALGYLAQAPDSKGGKGKGECVYIEGDIDGSCVN